MALCKSKDSVANWGNTLKKFSVALLIVSGISMGGGIIHAIKRHHGHGHHMGRHGDMDNHEKKFNDDFKPFWDKHNDHNDIKDLIKPVPEVEPVEPVEHLKPEHRPEHKPEHEGEHPRGRRHGRVGPHKDGRRKLMAAKTENEEEESHFYAVKKHEEKEDRHGHESHGEESEKRHGGRGEHHRGGKGRKLTKKLAFENFMMNAIFMIVFIVAIKKTVKEEKDAKKVKVYYKKAILVSLLAIPFLYWKNKDEVRLSTRMMMNDERLNW